MRELDLREVVLDTLKGLKVSADAKGLSLVCNVEPDVPALVRGDPGRLRQVLINLSRERDQIHGPRRGLGRD